MLQKLTDWLKEQLESLWDAFSDFMSDLFLLWLEHTFQMIVFAFDLLPVPSFLEQESLGSILGAAGPTVGWMVMTFRVGESLSLISAAMTFYIVRRLLTLGIW